MRKSKYNWIHEYWRAAFAWGYLAICLFDFLFAPALNIVLCGIFKITYVPWEPITIHGGGIFHIAAGAIVGSSAWTHGQADIEHVKNLPDLSQVPAITASANSVITNTITSQPSEIPSENYKRGIPKGP